MADFIDPDIEEKLEALEREEERLAAEGFYDENSDLELDSDDVREAGELKDKHVGRMESQATKKSMKNAARLPRTAGLKTLSELSEGLTKAGLDPSRIEARAAMIAKAQGAKRKRSQDTAMDVDEDDDGEDGDWMDVDEEGGTPQKRAKSNSGTVVMSSRAPRTNRQLAGLRDDAVRILHFSHLLFLRLTELSLQQAAKAIKLRNLGQRERNYQAKAGEADRAIKTKMVGTHDFPSQRAIV